MCEENWIKFLLQGSQYLLKNQSGLAQLQSKTNRGSHICVDLHNLNDGSGHDLLPTPFTDKILENIRAREVYSFVERFLGYHQVKIVQENRHKMTFVTELELFAYTMMPFRLENSLAIFSRIIVIAFKEFMHKFLDVYLDDWTMLNLLKQCIHLF